MTLAIRTLMAPLGAVAISACNVTHSTAQTPTHLATGDSVRIIATELAVVPNEKPGLLVEYNPFRASV